jgi:hypothetical protein
MNIKLISRLSAAFLGLACVASAQSYGGYENEDSSRYDRGEGQRTARDSVFIEGLGPGFLYSLNYERMLSDNVGLRFGFSYWSLETQSTAPTFSDGTVATVSSRTSMSVLAVPITCSYLGIGNMTHAFELGGGVDLLYVEGSGDGFGGDVNGAGVGAVAIAGYRYQPLDGGFMFRAGLSPLVDASGIFPWPYVSLGGTL